MNTARLLLATALAAGAVVLPAAGASAATTGPDFAEHVVTCAQTMGLAGDHNPGEHQGLSGWTGMPCEPMP